MFKNVGVYLRYVQFLHWVGGALKPQAPSPKPKKSPRGNRGAKTETEKITMKLSYSDSDRSP
jgi:hypothetical protein